MILLINICKERLHFYEFVKPILDILKDNNIDFFVKHYKELEKKDLDKAEKIIICGTSLKDIDYFEHYHNFDWLLDYDKPVLGICGGMQIICMVFEDKLKTLRKAGKGIFSKKTEVGFIKLNFEREFLGLIGEKEVYALHNYYVKNINKEFFILSKDPIPQAVKHKEKSIYGVLFHPEARNKDMIRNFAKL